MNLGNVVRYWAIWAPDSVHLVSDERSVTWAELDERTNRVANGLRALGVGPGDRVAIFADNCIEYCETAIASQKLGSWLVPINVRLTAPEVRHLLGHSRSSVLVVDAAHAALGAEAVTGLGVVTVGIGGTPAAVAFDALLEADATYADEPVSSDDVAYLCYTSGTTGFPKGAMLTHRNVWSMAVERGIAQTITPTDRGYLPFPLAFTGGLVSVWAPLYVAGAWMRLDATLEPGHALDVLERDRVTLFSAVPVVFETILRHPSFPDRDLSALRSAFSGGAPVPLALERELREVGIAMSQGYGLTEGCGHSLYLTAQDAPRKPGSTGRPMMQTRARVVDAALVEVERGTVGELVLRGDGVMAGYWDDPEATAGALVDGWLRTGDLATMDDEGYITIVDRAKDMLISGGLNVYPAEVERVIAGVGGVAEVAVIGLPDERWGEVPVAIVHPLAGEKVDADEVMAACRRELADYKRPRRIEVSPTPLPRGMSGKILKRELRGQLAGEGS